MSHEINEFVKPVVGKGWKSERLHRLVCLFVVPDSFAYCKTLIPICKKLIRNRRGFIRHVSGRGYDMSSRINDCMPYKGVWKAMNYSLYCSVTITNECIISYKVGIVCFHG